VADQTDAQLVTFTRDGSRDAYKELVSRYQGHVYGLAYSIVGNWADAQDVAQETFIWAYTNLDQLRDPARFAGWLRRVAFGVSMNWLRSFRPGLFKHLDGQIDPDLLEIADFKPGPAEVVQRRELADAVLEAIDSLPPKYRLPLTMFHLDGLSYKKVAEFLDIPLGTVQSLIHRARAKLKSALASYVTEDISPIVQEVFNEHKLPEEFAMKVIELAWVPAGRPDWHQGWITGFARGIQLIANELNGPNAERVDYNTVLGVLGPAFSIQADAESLTRYDGHNNVGWWPLEPLALERLDVVSKVIGYKARLVTVPGGAGAGDPVAVYREWFEPEIRASIDAGKPCLLWLPGSATGGPWWCIVTGYDPATPRLFGMCPNVVAGEEAVQTVTIEQLPGWLIVLGEPVPRASAQIADCQALRNAVDLHHDQSPVPQGWHTGLKSYGCWIAWLEDEKRYGEPARTHANSRGFLIRNRRTAVRYLEAMRQRHPESVGTHLQAAIRHFNTVIAEAAKLDTSRESVATAEGRQEIAQRLRTIREREAQAFGALEDALTATGSEPTPTP
jgi:RNA polymerase sigma-70 factor (ECF subfamily)